MDTRKYDQITPRWNGSGPEVLTNATDGMEIKSVTGTLVLGGMEAHQCRKLSVNPRVVIVGL